jgi:ribosomal-protein-alanine N-acetyltransferase
MIETERLQLVPYTSAQLIALISEPALYEELAGFPLADGMHEMYSSGAVSQAWIDGLRKIEGTDPWQLGFAVVHREAGVMMGSGGFKGPPDTDGSVEIAYGIAPAFQNRGHATEVAKALVTYAVADSRVRSVIAHTLPEPNASTKVLKRCGFEFRGEVVDPEDGLVWRWEMPVETRSQ